MKEQAIGNLRSNRILLLIVSLVLLLSLVTVSYAWFGPWIEFWNESFSGSSITAYFAGGDGSPEDPYQITQPVHIYNLAWLQYLGVFNRDEDQNEQVDMQYYFVLNNNVDMNGMIIPPIGTEENPFIGNFNGQGYCISRATVSNYVTETQGDGGIEQMPSFIDEIDTNITIEGEVQSNKAIVGFFGVVGDWDYSLDGKIADDSNVEIKDKVNKVYDLRLDQLTVRTDTRESLIGLLAGYVNGSVVNVGVGKSNIVIGESVVPLTGVTGIDVQLMVSRFSLIGDYDEENVAWPDQPILGGFGDSIALMDMYDQLQVAFNAKKQFEFVSAVEYMYVDGVQTNYQETKTTTSALQRVDWGSAGNYVFSVRDDGNTNYTYLYGDTLLTITKKYYTTRTPADYFYSGSNYLSLNSSNQVASETEQQAAAWSFDDQGHLYTKIENQSGGSTSYYLNRNSSGNLTASTSASTTWTKEIVNGTQGRLCCTVNGTKYYVYCNNGKWSLKIVGRNETRTSGYTIASGTNSYLNLSENGTIALGNDQNTATLWTFSNESSKSGYIYATLENGTTYYLTAQRSGSYYYYQYSLTTTTSQTTSWSNSRNVLSYTWSGSWGSGATTRYLAVSNGSWTLSSSSATLTISNKLERVNVENLVESDFNLSLSQNNTVQDLTETVTYKEKAKDTNATWFPLAIEEDEDGNRAVSVGNTGYVVSGSDYQSSNDHRRSGNIRVSKYSKSGSNNNPSGIQKSLTNNNLDHEKIYSISYKNKSFTTIDSVSDAESVFGFTRYGDSFDKLSNTLRNDSYVYGLHFMKATINMNDTIKINDARVVTAKGNQYYESGYELPRNAITFNLPEAGYVNFFAGTYFVSTSGTDRYENTTFFSLYQIFREEDGKTLSDIKEIAEIYGKIGTDGNIDESFSYVYKYNDGTYSDTLPSDYELVFSCDWIRDADKIGMQNYYVYYFEIPVNSGEFALGSVEGEDGAYLIYLDLAANGTRRVSSTAAHTLTGINFVDEAGLDPTFDIQDYPIVAIGVAFDGVTTNHGSLTVSYQRTSQTNMKYNLSGGGSGAFDLTFMGKGVTFEQDATIYQQLAIDAEWRRRRDNLFCGAI